MRPKTALPSCGLVLALLIWAVIFVVSPWGLKAKVEDAIPAD